MTVMQLIKELLLSGADPDAEVMVSAPGPSTPPGGMYVMAQWPTRDVEVGLYADTPVNGDAAGKPFVTIMGTDVWNMKPRRQK